MIGCWCSCQVITLWSEITFGGWTDTLPSGCSSFVNTKSRVPPSRWLGICGTFWIQPKVLNTSVSRAAWASSVLSTRMLKSPTTMIWHLYRLQNDYLHVVSKLFKERFWWWSWSSPAEQQYDGGRTETEKHYYLNVFGFSFTVMIFHLRPFSKMMAATPLWLVSATIWDGRGTSVQM